MIFSFKDETETASAFAMRWLVYEPGGDAFYDGRHFVPPLGPTVSHRRFAPVRGSGAVGILPATPLS
jgi:hypothetical protein